VISVLSSCLDNNTATTASTDPSFVSLTIAGNDSVKTAKFTLIGDTIVNLDSLPFRTPIDSVLPTFSFKSTSKSVIIFAKKNKFNQDSVTVTGIDTLFFGSNPIQIRNYPADTKAPNKLYTVKVNVHKVQPELYVWSKSVNDILNSTAKNQKTIYFNNEFHHFLNNGSSASLFKSTDGKIWSSSTVSGLPVNTPLNDIMQFNGKLFVTKDGLNIYSSNNDATVWSKSTMSIFTFKSLLYVFDNKLWAVVQTVSDSKNRFAWSYDAEVWNVIGEIPANFPVKDFAAIKLTTLTNKDKVLVIGGISGDDKLLKTRWSSENCVDWFDFSKVNSSLDSLRAGSSVILYDKKLLLFGGAINSDTLINFYRESRDEGLTWQRPNTVFNQIAIGNEFVSSITRKDTVTYSNFYKPHYYQSVMADSKSRIYLIGGKTSVTSTSCVSDVWTGKLNRLSFIRK
jgi:hypothetical protein